MTSCMLHSASHESSVWFESVCCEGVRYQVARISLGRRIDLARKIREAGRQIEFLESSGDVRERLEGAVLQGEIDRAYLEWGLMAIEGLAIDGEAATAESVISKGPLGLALEMLGHIRSECGLTEQERKN